MKIISCLFIMLSGLFFSCSNEKHKWKNDRIKIEKTSITNSLNLGSTISKNSSKAKCNYLNYFLDKGNTTMDTFRKKTYLVDPIDDTLSFKKAKFDFWTKDEKIFKKSKTYASCNGNMVTVQYFQDLTNTINLDSYRELGDRFFTTNNKVYFWWANSGGHLTIPIENADGKSFRPFPNICGGTDKNGIYYGSPNYGVYKLNISKTSDFEFIPKKNNYWNTPKHYVIIDNILFTIKFDYQRTPVYFCELETEITLEEVRKLKK